MSGGERAAANGKARGTAKPGWGPGRRGRAGEMPQPGPRCRPGIISFHALSRASWWRWWAQRGGKNHPDLPDPAPVRSHRRAHLIDGHDLRDVTLESLTQQIGMVTQETYLFHDTIRTNLLYARLDATQAEVEAAARAANIHDFIMGLPDGYDTWSASAATA
jgi:hypothetical protein